MEGHVSERLIGMLAFPRMTQLDLTGPYEVFARLPNTRVHLVAQRLDPIETDRGLTILPTSTYATCPQPSSSSRVGRVSRT